MDLTKVGAVSLAGAGGAGGGFIAYKYGAFDEPIKVREKVKGFVVAKEDDGVWSARVATLTSATSNTLHESLSKLKNPSFTKEGIRDWCIESLDSTFKEGDTRFKNVQDYCVYNNKDKLGSSALNGSETSKWTTVQDSLKNENGTLSNTMKAIKNKLKGEGGVTKDENALKTWCEGFYSEIWMGEEDPDFKDAKTYCKEKAASAGVGGGG
ncbi:hypothetical protein HF1_14130 [Mycoplasma haemofelis str. Langford 1]|uniref:Uncharacterized protein n=1 Tax=Mycoplasma haemofelis (strain Langford 1) TaxID=941640 RepID=E8ZJV0_MYCHL|nr:hypothetical protein [Mycoplasma haemofelis]CBY93421.1 hypothetical protein HF1_14130 [Mycoplasma haemofelis str. Langford 1]